jgi:hypothetical protein
LVAGLKIIKPPPTGADGYAHGRAGLQVKEVSLFQTCRCADTDISLVAVTSNNFAGDAKRQLAVHDRNIDRALQAVPVVVAESGFEPQSLWRTNNIWRSRYILEAYDRINGNSYPFGFPPVFDPHGQRRATGGVLHFRGLTPWRSRGSLTLIVICT